MNELAASIFLDFFDKAVFAMQMADVTLRYLAPPVPRTLAPRTWPHHPTQASPREPQDALWPPKGLRPQGITNVRHGAGCMAR